MKGAIEPMKFDYINISSSVEQEGAPSARR